MARSALSITWGGYRNLQWPHEISQPIRRSSAVRATSAACVHGCCAVSSRHATLLPREPPGHPLPTDTIVRGRSTPCTLIGGIAMTRFAHRAQRVQPSAIREFLALAGDPRITSFAGGYPDPTLFPMDELHAIYDDLLSARNASALQYTASEGLPELRALVAARLTADGMPCTADDVLITQGGQQGLDLNGQAV